MTLIQWTDVTDNIIRVKGGGWWCRKISPGCKNCYAAEINQNDFFGGNKLPYSGEPPELELREDLIDGWKAQRKPRKHFVCSMTDVFGEWVPFDWAVRFLRGMWCAPKQTFQVLTKRPAIARDYITRWLALDGLTELPPNIWIGTSVEDQKTADERIPELLGIPARIRFLSVEPMLERIHLSLEGGYADIHWSIFGGESGHGARPCNIDWIRDGVKQCRSAGVKVFTKQLGSFCVTGEATPDAWPVGTELVEGCSDERLVNLRDKKGGDIEEFPADLRIREFPEGVTGNTGQDCSPAPSSKEAACTS